ncbi:type 1 glutamine amidotransferase domain-containing protein [Rothia halotolerans]|uniref:type 1 glutamine amidotransferase domain-containing protein n=1 Tax=Rothia halotolerans TaxID=405770 RepID=UPI00101B5ED3|nr:type 1 glutamine amidotransferase domain-containing protein [Rothia halotolerans]
MADLSSKKVAFLLTHGVEQAELTEPRKALDEAGATTRIVSPAGETLTAMKGDWDHADTFDVDVALADADPSDYDALVLPGGTVNADTIRIAEGATDFVKAFLREGKTVAAICHGPWILAEADALRGRSLTSFQSIRVDLQNAGAEWQDSQVVVDNNLITSRNPGDLEAFSTEIIKALS